MDRSTVGQYRVFVFLIAILVFKVLDDGTLLKRYRKEISELKKQLSAVFVTISQECDIFYDMALETRFATTHKLIFASFR